MRHSVCHTTVNRTMETVLVLPAHSQSNSHSIYNGRTFSLN